MHDTEQSKTHLYETAALPSALQPAREAGSSQLRGVGSLVPLSQPMTQPRLSAAGTSAERSAAATRSVPAACAHLSRRWLPSRTVPFSLPSLQDTPLRAS